MTLRLLSLLTLFAAPLALTACSSGDPDDDGPGEQELITRVVVTLTNEDDLNDSVTITANDPDGDGAGITFSPTSVTLRPGATYAGTIELTDTINNEDITEEIEEEAEEHLFRYAFDPASAGTITLTDTESDYTTEDENGGNFQVGLTFRATVSGNATGQGRVVALLYHFDDAPKTSSTATSDELDIDIEFPVEFNAPVVRVAP